MEAVDVLAALATGPGEFRGTGVNHEGEAFDGVLQVLPLEGSRAVLLRYVATLADGTVVHSESALLGSVAPGRLGLWPVMSELPHVLPHEQVHAGRGPEGLFCTLASGPRDDRGVFREEISLHVRADGAVVYAHAWGLPDDEFGPRSSCTMWPHGA